MLDDKPILPTDFPAPASEADVVATPFSPETFISLLPSSRAKLLASTSQAVIRWVHYGRYSTNLQDDDSLDRQKRNCAPLWKDGILVACITDPARSGMTTHNRPGLARLMKMVRNHEIDAVAIENVDRLSRNLGQLLLIYEEMQLNKVDLYDHTHGKLDFIHIYLLGLMAQMGRDRMIELMRDGQTEKVSKGRVLSAPVFGYAHHGQLGNKLRIVDEALRPLVIWIFERIAEGATCYQVAKDLCDKYPSGPPSARGSKSKRYKPPYDEQFVRRLIYNPIYMGVNAWKREKQIRDFLTRKVTGTELRALAEQMLVEVKHLAIVSKNLWARANAALDERNPGVGLGGKRSGPFSGRLLCTCGAPMKRVGPADRRDLCCEARSYTGAFRCDAFTQVPLVWVESVLLDRLFLGDRRAITERALSRACRCYR